MEKFQSFSEILKAKIKASDLSYRAISRSCGVSAATISRFMADKMDINLSTADTIWKALHEAKSDR